MVRVPFVVHLKAERVLQDVVRLLVCQPRDHGRPLDDPDDPEVTGFGERTSHLVNLSGSRYPVGLPAQVKLGEWAESR